MDGPIQGELLPPEPEPKCEHCGDDGYCEECGVDHDEGSGSTDTGGDEEPIEQPDPVVEGILAKLADIEHEAKAALHSLQQGGTNFKVSECECVACKAVAPVVGAMQAKSKTCSCRLCLLTNADGDQGHSGSCSCKLCRAARGTIRAAQQLKGIIENEW